MAKFRKKYESSELDTLLKDSSIPKTYEKGNVISGVVIHSDENMMLLDVGARSEGIVSGKELKLDGKKVIKSIGDEVLVYVVIPENKAGQVELSIRKTGDELKWHELEQAKEKNESIKVKVIEANSGGVLVEIGGGIRGFVPSSQLKNSRIHTTMEYDDKDDATKMFQSRLAQMIDEELDVVIMEIDREKSKVVLSERWNYTKGDLQQRNKTLESVKKGDILEGRITGIAPFGLFVDAEGLEGLVHLSEISWDKVINPADFHNVGDKVKVQFLSINDDGKKVAYSIKRLKTDPWKNIVQKYKVGEIVEGVVKSIVDYGAFVTIEEGLNGLIHISELSHKLVNHPRDIVKKGDKLKVMIISISNDDRHLGLSLKRLKSPTTKKKQSVKKAEKAVDPETAPEMAGLDELIKDSTKE